MAAAPLVCEVALRSQLDRLDPSMKKDGPTFLLWRRSETELAAQMPAASLEELVAVRDMLWFPQQDAVPLHRYMRRLAEEFLDITGDEAVPRTPAFWIEAEKGLPAPARRLWRWLSLALPPDLLAAAHPHAHGRERVVAPLLKTLSQTLQDREFAEVHCHLGAAVDFPTFWSWTLRALGDPKLDPKDFANPGAPLDEGRELAPWLLRAAIARQVLGCFLRAHATGTGAPTLEAFLRAPHALPLPERRVFEVRRALRDLLRGTFREDGDFASLRSAYAALTGVDCITWPSWTETGSDVPRDPLDRELKPFADGWFNPELRYVREALHYLDQGVEAPDPLFSKLFWQTVRARCLYYRYLTVRPLSVGLQWFMRFFDRTKPARRGPTTKAALRAALKVMGHGQGLRSLELRLGPPSSENDALMNIRDLYEAATTVLGPSASLPTGNERPPADRRPVELGFVMHFGRDRDGGMRKGVPLARFQGTHADPSRPTNQGRRYYAYSKTQWQSAMALSELLRHYPASLSLLRGIDVCSDELGIPTWVIRPLFALVREAGVTASRLLRRRGHDIPPLHVTAHAGEDFVHLLTGLRRIDEALELLACQHGDRLGHGVALGVEPRTWARDLGVCVMPREERLFDLLWEWRHYGRDTSLAGHGRAEYVAREIQRHAREIFGDSGLTPYLMQCFVERLNGTDLLKSHPLQLEPLDRRPCREDTLVDQYLHQPEVFTRCVEPIMVDPREDLEAVTALQLALRLKVGARGIAVEINPTSNLLTGNLADLEHHPLWRLRPPRQQPGLPPLDVCIGSDDPLLFSTTLREEYQKVYDALCLGGLTDTEAWRWLDEVRDCAFRYRFTLAHPPMPPDFIAGEESGHP